MAQSTSLSLQEIQDRWWFKLLYQAGFCIILLVAWEWLNSSGIWEWLGVNGTWSKLLHELGFCIILFALWERLASSRIWEELVWLSYLFIGLLGLLDVFSLWLLGVNIKSVLASHGLAQSDILLGYLFLALFGVVILVRLAWYVRDPGGIPKLLRQIGFYIILLVTWERLARENIWPSYIFAGPIDVKESLSNLLQNGVFFTAVRVSLSRLVVGYFISLVLGIGVGLFIGLKRLASETLGSLIIGLQALPSVCWIPFALLWFGLNESALVFVVVMGALFCIIVGVEAGVKNTPPVYVKAARNMGASGFSLAMRVVLPAALPSIITGLKQGWAFAWRSLMAAELVAITVSLGGLLEISRNNIDIPQMFGIMATILVLGVLFDIVIFGPLERTVRTRWGFDH